MHGFLFSKRAFTIVEVLVAVAVIAMLSVILYSAADSYRKSARDKERKIELQNIALALRMYKDSYGRYPAGGCSAPSNVWTSPGPGNEVWYSMCDTYITGLVPDYISALPTDPNESQVNGGYLYLTNADGSEYKLVAHETVEGGVINKGEDMARCPSSCTESHCSQRSYAVYTPGYACK